ncbi:amidohydrolase [Rhodococcus sp. NPDC059968]|uniref:amidohydrolase n=1 Tax=Rhodococcus sp. NPDC059968 TaxID=3347017 RepID=UPI00366AF8CA
MASQVVPTSPFSLLGNVRTMNTAAPTASMVRIDGAHITGTGSDRPIGAVLDAGSRTVLPGFVDVHAHVEVASVLAATTVDIRVPLCRTVSDVLERLHAALADVEDGDWLIGRANLFYDYKLDDRRYPTLAELDAVSRTVPIALRAGGHVSVLNSKAMELADLDRLASLDQGLMGKARVFVDESGARTGVVAEVDGLLPIPPLPEDRFPGLIESGVLSQFSAHGVTTIGEITETVPGTRAMSQVAAAGRLSARVEAYLWVPGTFNEDNVMSWRETGIVETPQHYRVRGVKLFVDGGYTAKNAAVKKPYPDGSYGELNLTKEQIIKMRGLCDEAGLQVAIHSNGDRAQEWVCEALIEGGFAGNGVPTRLEHAGNIVLDWETPDHWREAGILPSPQPPFVNTSDFAASFLGDAAKGGLFPFRRLLDEGWAIPGSSDVHLGSEPMHTNPMFGVACAVTRIGFVGEPVELDQAVTVDEALQMYTINGARTMGIEHERGSLEAGKLADVIVLDRDLSGVADHDLRDVQVDYVFRGGELVHQREGAKPLQHAQLETLS